MKFYLIFLILFVFLHNDLTAQINLKEGLQGFYTFSSNADDESGNENHGELLGGASTNTNLSIKDNDIDAVSIPNNVINGFENFSISIEVYFEQFRKSTTDATSNFILGGWSSQSKNDINFEYIKQRLTGTQVIENLFQIFIGGDRYWFSNIELFEGVWYHIVLIREGETLNLYLDGKEIGTGISVNKTPIDVIQNGLIIGQEQDELRGGFLTIQSLFGKLDNLYFYNRAINEGEVEAIFTGGLVDNDEDGYAYVDDCDDNNSKINPGASETPYNGIDEDCNPSTLDDDLDQDGFLLANDCDDNNASINSSQVETPYNGVDDDCNSATLDDDLDQDGFIEANDCDDNNALINSSQMETPYNGTDDDCNPATLDDDLDQDGFVQASDCDDNNANVNPDAMEILNNEVDENCDGMVEVTPGIHEFANTTLNIFPNPASDFIKIEMNKYIPFEANLYDLQGKLIISQKNKQTISLVDLNKSIYLLEVSDLKTHQTVVDKIVVVK